MCPRTNRRRGFTLSEIIVTMTIVGFITIGVVPFFLQNSRYLFTGEQKLLINADIRDFTNEMIEHARSANYFVLYRSFHQYTRSDGTLVRRDANNNGTINAADRRASGLGGDFLVFVYYEDPFFDDRFYDGNPDNNEITTVRVTRLIGYWLAPHRELSGKHALYFFDSDSARTAAATSWTTGWGVTFPATLSSSVTLETLLPAATVGNAQAAFAEILMNDLEGLGADSDVFGNYMNRSVLVRAKILHGNQAKRVTNTYNFTVTPRG